MQDNALPGYDRAPSNSLTRLCSEGGLLRPLIELNGEGAAKQHGNVPLDVHFDATRRSMSIAGTPGSSEPSSPS